MKVNGNKPPERADVVWLQKTGKNGAAQPTEKPAVLDKVEVSGKAKELGDIVNVVKSLPDVRTEMVDGIKGQIDSGKYVVDPVKVAQKMIDEIV
jgi:negative regulator of flagellin synthesis FlgM